MFVSRYLVIKCLSFFALILLCSHLLTAERLLVPESILEREICSVLGVRGDELTAELVSEKLTSLELNDANLRDLRGLEVAQNLEVLILRDNLINDLAPISKLPKLRKLDVSGNRISSLRTFGRFSLSQTKSRIVAIQDELQQKSLKDDYKADLVLELSEQVAKFKLKNNSLTELNLSNNRLLGLSGIEMCDSITWLNVADNSLIDLEGISKLKSLITFYAQGNQLGRVESYEDVNRNKTYDLGEPIQDQSGNGKRDTDPLVELQSLPRLRNLYLYNNMLKNVDSLDDLSVLSVLLLSGNQIETVREIGKLSRLERLSLNINFIYELNGLEKLENLKHLDLTENRICDLRPIASLRKLKELRLQSNHVLELNPLSRLQYLNTLSLSKNVVVDPYPLNNLKSLRNLKLSNNRIDLNNPRFNSMFSMLEKRGCRIGLTEQFNRNYGLEMLLKSLTSFSSSNRDLGRFLQEKGYLRFIDFVLDPKINEKNKEDVYLKWDESFKRGVKMEELDFPDQ